MKLKKGDHVRVIAGKDVGKEGDIARVFPETDRVIVDGVNVAKRHTRAQGQTMQGGIIDKDMPIPVSNVAVISPSDGKPTRIGYRFTPEGEKVRVCKRTGADL
jgi:large subunit ribosomal protein L24